MTTPNPSRADYNVPIATKQNGVYFSDFPTNFDMSPNSGDLARVINTDAVIQSVANLILNFQNERPYLKFVGSAVQIHAFELNDAITSQLISSAIQTCIKQNEPRASIQSVLVNTSQQDNNAYEITIYFNVINSPVVQVYKTLLSRDR
jgi:phage baseplate assembly protein W